MQDSLYGLVSSDAEAKENTIKVSLRYYPHLITKYAVKNAKYTHVFQIRLKRKPDFVHNDKST